MASRALGGRKRKGSGDAEVAKTHSQPQNYLQLAEIHSKESIHPSVKIPSLFRLCK